MCSLLANVFMIALYAVQVFSRHEGCYSRSGFNITTRFEAAFKVGLCVFIAEMINTNICHIYCRMKVQVEERKCGMASKYWSETINITNKV